MIEIHAYIEVEDLQEGIDFYCNGFDLSLKRQLGPRWVELAGAVSPIFLLGNMPPTVNLGGTEVPRDYERHRTPVHLDFIVEDLEKMVERLLRLGASLDRDVLHPDYGKMANMADPFGNSFDLIEFSGDGYDGIAAGQ